LFQPQMNASKLQKHGLSHSFHGAWMLDWQVLFKHCYNGEIGYIIDLIYVTLIRRKSEILAAIESYLISLTLWK
jgi:hypothetical protein